MSGLRHAEYYGMQEVFDGLYAKSSKNETFTNLMNIILKRENILLAYRNIKSNDGSKTPGTDGVTFDDIGKLMPDEVIDTVRFITIGSTHGYRPKPVRRKEIPKPYDPTKTRPLGIPCVWDRLVQQCIKQVMEPICEAKFHERNNGFRPYRSTQNAIEKAINGANKQLLSDSYLTENDLFDYLGIEHNHNGDLLGWDTDNTLNIETFYSSKLDEDGMPCLVLDYRTPPKWLGY